MKTPQRRLDVIVHPVRTRILVALAGRQLTTAQLHETLPDVPPPSLYRHLRVLLEAAAIEVVEERPSRGQSEKVYALAEGGGQLKRADYTSAEDHVTAFAQFAAMLSANFQQYVQHPEFDYTRDFAYMLADPLQLTKAEFDELIGEINALIESRSQREPTPGSTRRVFAVISIPEKPIRE